MAFLISLDLLQETYHDCFFFSVHLRQQQLFIKMIYIMENGEYSHILLASFLWSVVVATALNL